MKKQIIRPATTNYIEISVCDNCGKEFLQDDIIFKKVILGIFLDLHHGCTGQMEKKIRKNLGLHTGE